MKVGIKWHGDDLKYVNTDDLTLESGITLGQYINNVADEISGLKSELAKQQDSITKLQADIETVKLENLRVMEDLLRR